MSHNALKATLGVLLVILQSHLNALQTNAVPFVTLSPTPIIAALKPIYAPRRSDLSLGVRSLAEASYGEYGKYLARAVTLTKMERVELPRGYKLEEVGQNLLLKRPNGYVLAAFGKGVKPENIQRVAEADEKYLRAVERKDRFGLAADAETVIMFSEDVKEARTEYLLALEEAYRGKDT